MKKHGLLGSLITIFIFIVAISALFGGNDDDTDDQPDHTQTRSEAAAKHKKKPEKKPKPAQVKPVSKPQPKPKQQPRKQLQKPAPAPNTALAVLNTLPVRGEDFSRTYQRVADFGKAWIDMDGNGCDTRDDILARDLQNITYKNHSDCKIASGVLHDPYSGRTINFVRGWRTSRAVQIDHVVPLGDAWRTGAENMSCHDREELANDPLNLLAVGGPTNIEKSDKDASEWLPPNRSFDCPYVARQVAVKKKYNLWVTGAEKNAMSNVLRSCPAQGLPR